MTERAIGGKYRLEREIARGGMGAIWSAMDTQLQRRVAVKLMSPDHGASATLRARFEREATAIAQLQSPNVIQVYDYGIDDGAPYIVMELLEGEDLDARLKRHRRMPIPAAAQLINQIAKALTAAHGAGIIHRDLKPGNIFLVRGESEEVVKVLDFGVAALSGLGSTDMHQTRAGALLGTPLYMSPEQARSSRTIDHRSDLWSLAVVAFRALTGSFPFAGESLGDLIVNICTDAPAVPSSFAPELGAEVDQFFARALARDPGQRFQSARELAAAFAALGSSAEPKKTTKILVVDDEPDVEALIRQRFRQQIRRGIYDFVFAGNGAEALERLREHPDVEVVFTDINMPTMDGLTFLGKVADIAQILKVVVVSAYGDMTNIRAAMNRGAFDFLVKPLDFKDLELTMEKTIKHVHEIKRTVRSTEENSFLRMFVSHGLVERVLPSTRHVDGLANEAVEATVAFIDLHGFTAVLKHETPDAAIRRLNANFEVMVPEVKARKGDVDKFMGDAVLAVFRGDGHRERAIDACLAIRDQLRDMAARAGDLSPYGHGVSIGIDSGTVVVGGIGSKLLGRLDYTVLGEVVNNAARLQATAGRGQILIAEPLYEAVQETFACGEAGMRVMAGKAEPVAVFDVQRRSVDDLTIAAAPTQEISSFEGLSSLPAPSVRRQSSAGT